MFILDCCRDFRYTSSKEPGDAKQLDLGLKIEEAKSVNGTIFARSCGPNSKALDGKGNNGAELMQKQLCLYIPGVVDFACSYTTSDCVGTRGDPLY